jgi:hypothetical protein
MQLDLVTLEVDGSLRNPVVVLAVTTWAAILVIVSALGAIGWVRAQTVARDARGRGVAMVIGAAIVYLSTPVAQAVIGNIIYAALAKWDGGPQ